jgi:TonB family protein
MKLTGLIYKFIFLWFIFSAFCVKHAHAQVDTILSYIKIDKTFAFGDKDITVKDKADADFVRMVTMPDSNIDKTLYQVYDYYLNGNPKLRGSSTTGTFRIQLEGSFIEYYPDGHKKRIAAYKFGQLDGDFVEFYPDGKVYLSGIYDDNGQKVDKSYNKEGKVIAEAGNGKQVLYNDDQKAIGEGMLVNGRRDGQWKGALNDSVTFEIKYDMGKVVSGVSRDNKGKRYPFSQVEAAPQFKGGLKVFGAYVSRNLHYPDDARRAKIQGRVILGFIVDRDGSIRDVEVVKGLGYGCDEVAVKALKSCPPWIPGTLYGLPVKVQYKVPVSFSLPDD